MNEKTPLPRIIPRHVAIIMDGNGRWARREGKPIIEGHRQGGLAAKAIVQKALDLGIEYLTLYAFSSENWLRPVEWVEQYMQLLRYYLTHEFEAVLKDDIRLCVIGERERLPLDVVRMIDQLEARSANNSRMMLVVALSYGAHGEIVRAVQRIIEKGISPQAIDAQVIADHLYTAGIPNPDLLIRTSGEHRLSNFLLWQLAYSELVFCDDSLWPDFTPGAFEKALQTYGSRHRRFGAAFGESEKIE